MITIDKKKVDTDNIALACVQLKHRLGELGLFKTMQAMEATVTAVGYELAERIEKCSQPKNSKHS